MSLGTKILIGVSAGVALGVFLGELCAPLGVVGKIYVGLLQMTVLPYVTVSLITRIGGLDMRQAKRLGGQAGVIMLLLWAVSLIAVAALPLSLPEWKAGTFFSSSLIERPAELDFLGLYLPTNPFHSLANNIVPAAVIFSILVGVALINIPGKQRILEPANVASDALSWISGLVVRLSPLGTFALTADAAGRLAPAELTRLAGYVSTNTIGVIFLTFVALPGLVAALSPFRFRTILSGFRGAGLTAFATGKLFAVLPIVIESVRDQLTAQDVPKEEASAMADVFVPLGYPFPNAGRILALLFIPFAAWYVGRPLDIADYPMLLGVGLLAFFGSPIAAIPFLLDMLRIPQDTFPLFLVAGVWCARLGDVLGAMHLTAFTLLSAAWKKGWLSWNLPRLGAWAAYSGGIGALLIVANHFLVDAAMSGQEPSHALVGSLDLRERMTAIEVDEKAAPNPSTLREGEKRIDRIRRTGELRVGYLPKHPPFCYRNGTGKLVGFDIDLIQRLAAEIGVGLRLVPYRPDSLDEGFARDHFDVAIGGIPSSLDNLAHFQQSVPYLELHAAILVLDHRAREFRDFRELIRKERVTLGYTQQDYLVRTNHHRIRGVELKKLPSKDVFLRGEAPGVDALLTTAETGAVLSMLHPEFSLVVPTGTNARVPIVIAIQRDAREADRTFDIWLELKRADGTLEELYAYWILGERTRMRKPRWSVIRDLLGWVD